MVIKIHQAVSTRNALFYNERKVERHLASFWHSRNMPVLNPFHGDKNDRCRVFEVIEGRNSRVKKKGLHISVNPTISDLVHLGDVGLRKEIDHLMDELGYGHQPYLVYKHADLERVHFHIVSTRIDCETGKKIKDNYEREKTQRFIRGMEERYGLTRDAGGEEINFRFSPASRNLRLNLENLFVQLNRMEMVSSRELYDEALRLFQVEIRQAGRGFLVFVTDQAGRPVRYPVKMSNFQTRPNFYESQEREVAHSSQQKNWLTEQGRKIFRSVLMKELIRGLNGQFYRDIKDKKCRVKRPLRQKKGRRYR